MLSVRPILRAGTIAVTVVALFACAGESADPPAAANEAAALDVASAKEKRRARAALARRVTVSGVSSGAYMAVQAHVALADRISGVASIAGGPWHCAEGQDANAIGRCLTGEGVRVPDLLAYAYELSASGEIAPVDALAASRVFIFHSPVDDLVSPSLSDALAEFYAGFVDSSRIAHESSVAVAHGWPAFQTGADCTATGDASANACHYDTAGALLAHLYGELAPRVDKASVLDEINLAGYFAEDSGVASNGFVYVPATCREAADACRLHVVFHSCGMGAEFVGDDFARTAGYNEWAESNGIVVAYPQVEKSASNPQGCWDWWGYTGANYDRRRGKQVSGVARLIQAFEDGGLAAR